jgi:hypothetical protein
MSSLLIVGAGGHARVVADAALTMGQWQRVCFVDDSPGASGGLGLAIVGTSADLSRLRVFEPSSVLR